MRCGACTSDVRTDCAGDLGGHRQQVWERLMLRLWYVWPQYVVGDMTERRGPADLCELSRTKNKGFLTCNVEFIKQYVPEMLTRPG